jgi:hypothetical protein
MMAATAKYLMKDLYIIRKDFIAANIRFLEFPAEMISSQRPWRNLFAV